MDVVKVCLVLSTAVVLAASTDCPDRWIAFEGSCYLFGHDHVHFTEAEEYCRHHNAHLVEVHTADEQAFLSDFMRELKPDRFWIGMTDETIEGVWKWYSSGGRVEQFYWGPTEPQDYGSGEDCAIYENNTNYKWADVPCAWNHRALCEMRTGSGSEIVG